ncbi:unnamed protein product [Arabis nemorensis]|uniref:Uncharacterized protein n=1 Tax=Arabis nemorensis TaxID=586526 RepID=A0A565C2Z8_9BRAS|nr:unnamed protein product [Arabis nemorensis]
MFGYGKSSSTYTARGNSSIDQSRGLGVFVRRLHPDNTFEERNKLRNHKRYQYCAWKEECRKMVPLVGCGNFVTMAVALMLLERIGISAFYENESNQARLWDILSIYTWLYLDMGYVQGKSTLAIMVNLRCGRT